jgi:CelD/BcsL family acetyltransferase involved in cellulose biosynthesis
VEVVSDTEALRALRPEWDRLSARSADGNPFTRWVWTWHWWRAYGRSRPWRRHRLQVFVLRDSGGDARAIVPFVRTTWGVSPLAARALRLAGFGDNTPELRAPLIEPAWEPEAVAAVADALHARVSSYDWCDLDGIPSDGPLAAWAGSRVAAGEALWQDPLSDYVLPLPATWEALRARLRRNVKENIRHAYNSLGREGHDWRVDVVSAADALDAALEEFFGLHAARSAMAGAPHHPNHYGTAPARELLKGAARDLAATGDFHVFRLWVDGMLAASRIVLTGGDSVFLSYSGFDPAWRRYGVMTLLTTECLKQSIREGRRVVNLSTGTDPSKLRWGPEEVVFRSLRLYAPTVRARLAARLHQRALLARNRRLARTP